MHTFVIPAYKESPYLEQCIQCLLSQTSKSAIIITTSTPTDFTQQMAHKYGLEYYVGNEKGIASDWNFALSKATTPLVTIAHQDDVYEPDYATNIIAAYEKNRHAQIFFTGYNDLLNGIKKAVTLNSVVKSALLLPFAFTSAISNRLLKKLLLAFGDPICCPSVTFNMQQLNGFQFSQNLTCALDWYAWYQMADLPGAFCFVNKKLVNHRIHPESETTFQLSQGIRKQEELQMFRLIWGKRIASLLSWVYTLGHADNKV